MLFEVYGCLRVVLSVVLRLFEGLKDVLRLFGGLLVLRLF